MTSSYTPTPPFSAQVNSVLMQDGVTTDNIVVNTDPNGWDWGAWVASFCNPCQNGSAEAFIVAESDGEYSLNHLAQDPSAPRGWTLTPVPDNGTPGTYLSVTACIADAYPNYFCTITNPDERTSTIRQGWLDADGNASESYHTLDMFVQPLKVTYYLPALQGASDGPIKSTVNTPLPILYTVGTLHGQGAWYVLTYTWTGNTWVTQQVQMDPYAENNLFDLWDWTLLPVSHQLGCWSLVGSVDGSNPGWALTAYSYNGEGYAVQSPYSQFVTPNSPAPVSAAKSLAGACWTGEYGLRPLYTDTDGVPFLYDALYGSIVPPVNTPGTITMAQAVINDAGMTSMYLVDSDESLSFLPQTGFFSSKDAPDKYTIQWAPSVAISSSNATTCGVNEGTSALYPSFFPGDPPTLFTANAAGELRLYQLNPGSDAGPGGWMTHTPALSQDTTYALTTYRTQLTVTDLNGVPVAQRSLNVSASTVTAAVLNGSLQIIGPGTGQDTTITTTAAGTATIALVATDFAPATLTFADAGDPSADSAGAGQSAFTATAAPGGPVQAYLAGSTDGIANGGLSATGSLNYMGGGNTTFSPDTMSGAQLADGSGPLFPGVQGDNPVMTPDQAHTAVQNLMAKGSGATSGPDSAPALAGFIINRDIVSGRPRYQEFHDRDAYLGELAHHNSVIGLGLLGDIESFLDSVWQGIKSAAMTVYHVGANLVDGIVQIAVKIGDAVVNIGNIIIKGIEDAVNVVMAVFSAIEAAIKDVIEFLKAAFDVSNIFATQQALAQGLEAAISAAQTAIGKGIDYLQPNGSFFTNLTNDLNGFLNSATSSGAGAGLTLSTSPNWQTTDPSSVTSNTTPIPGTGSLGGTAVSPSDVTTSPHIHYATHQTFGAVSAPPAGTNGANARTGTFSMASAFAGTSAGTSAKGGASSQAGAFTKAGTGARRATPRRESTDALFWKLCRQMEQSQAAKNFVDDLKKLGEWLVKQVDPKAPSTWDDLNIQELLDQIVETGLDTLLVLLDEIAIDVLTLLQDFLTDFTEDVLQAPMTGALADPLLLVWNLLSLLDGKGADTKSITLEQGITLLMAVPINVLGAIITDKPSCLTWPPPFPTDASAPGARAPEGAAAWAIYCGGGFFAELVAGIAYFSQDVCPPPESLSGPEWKVYWEEIGNWVSLTGALANLAAFILSMPLESLTTWPLTGWGAGMALASAGMIVWELFRGSKLNQFFAGGGTDENAAAKAFVLSLINMGLGLVYLAIGVASVCEEEKGKGWDANRIMALISAIISPTSNVASIFGTKVAQDIVAEVKYIPPTMDIVSYWGGGGINLLVNLGVGES